MPFTVRLSSLPSHSPSYLQPYARHHSQLFKAISYTGWWATRCKYTFKFLGGCGHFGWEVNYLTRIVYLPDWLRPPKINSDFILWAEVLIEDFSFLAELETLWATVALVTFALFETAWDISDVDWAAKKFLDLEVVIFAMEICGRVRQDTIHLLYKPIDTFCLHL